MRTLAYVVLLLVWSTCAAFAFAHRVADGCADCNSVAYSVQLRLQKELPAELVEVERRINETCSSVGCPRKTAKVRESSSVRAAHTSVRIPCPSRRSVFVL
jgi:hypothetical protein